MKKILFAIFVAFLLGLFLPINNAGAIAIPGWSELDDFDDYNLGDTSGCNGDFCWEKESGSEFKIQGSADPGGDKYLRVGDQTNGVGWFNVSNSSFRGYYFMYRGYCGATSVCSSTQWTTYYNYYNLSGNITVKFKTWEEDYYWGSGTYDHTTIISYQNYEGDWVQLINTGRQTSFDTYYVSWQHYINNVITYKVYNDADVLLTWVNGTGLISGENYTSDNQFNCSNMTFNANYYESCSEGTGTYTIFEYGITEEELDIYSSWTPGDDVDGRCSNPNPSQGAGYDQIFEIDPQGCEPDWLCIIVHTIAIDWVDMINDCVDCPWDMVPARYIEHQTEDVYSERIRHVLLPVSNDQIVQVSDDPNDYNLMINSNYTEEADYIVPYDLGYGIVWENVNVTVNGKINFAVGCDEQTDGFALDWYWYGVAGFPGGWGTTKVHNSPAKFFDGINTGTYPGNWKLSICWYFDNSSYYNDTDPENIPTIDEFDDIFGDGDEGKGYIEWLGWNTECYYRMNLRETPSIVFNLSGLGTGNGSTSYYYNIYRVTPTEPHEIVYNDFIEVLNKDYYRDIWVLNDFEFPSSGRYYITVWNTTGAGAIELDTKIHTSLTITVCPAYSGGGDGDVTGIFPYLGPLLGAIVGLIFTTFMILVPFILQGMFQLDRVHPVVYMLTGSIGLSISTIFGWFPAWLPFFIIAIGIIIIVFTYLYQKSQSLG